MKKFQVTLHFPVISVNGQPESFISLEVDAEDDKAAVAQVMDGSSNRLIPVTDKSVGENSQVFYYLSNVIRITVTEKVEVQE